jgi:FkbM family methyltransferase
MKTAKRYIREKIASTIAGNVPGLLHVLAGEPARKTLRLEVTVDRIDVVDRNSPRRIRLARQNAVYVLDMLNAFEYYYGSAEPVRVKCGRQYAYVVDFSTPRFQKINGFSDFPIMCSSLTEPYVTIQQYLDFAGLEPGHVVLDLGAYSALTSIAFSKEVGSAGKVIALEPDAANFVSCRTNLAYHEAINQLHNVVLVPAAVGVEKGSLSFSAEGAMGSAAAEIVGGYRGEIVRVEALTLHDIVEQHALERIDFIKMDIEGAEEKVIAEALAVLKKYRPRIIVEPHNVGGEMSTDKVIALLQGCSYACGVIPQIGVTLPLVVAEPLA